ncbi:MAG: CopG family antitoxin [Caldilineaceae bacterium]
MDKQTLNERDPIPQSFASLEEAGEFWDTHDSADYEDLMEEVAFEIDLSDKPAYHFAVAKDLAAALHDIAKQQGVSTQTLINLWLQEKLLHTTN